MSRADARPDTLDEGSDGASSCQEAHPVVFSLDEGQPARQGLLMIGFWTGSGYLNGVLANAIVT